MKSLMNVLHAVKDIGAEILANLVDWMLLSRNNSTYTMIESSHGRLHTSSHICTIAY